MSEPIMQLKHIKKGFFGVPVLHGVDLDIFPGKVHALVGGNGAGKSTMMKILTGVYTKDEGEILLNGKQVEFGNYKDAFDNGIAMIFQEMSSVPTLTVTENIFLNNEITNKSGFIDRPQMRKKAAELLDKLGVSLDPDAKVSDLSVGETQMVEIVKALSADAKVLVMDEPTASLSAKEVELLFEIVRNLKRHNIAIVYISHRMNEILEIADEVTVLRDGNIVANIENDDALTVETIISYMMGETASSSFAFIPSNYNRDKDETILKVRDLNVNSWVRDISFELHKGEVIGFAGLMSSGRTEILETLFGIREYESGHIEIDGCEVNIRNTSDAISAGFGLIPENRRTQGLVLEHTLRQNLTLPTLDKLKKGFFLSGKKMDDATNQSIKELSVKTDSIHRLIRMLSGGNQQKIVISKWLRSDMRIMLLDEPTAGVDIGTKKEVINTVRSFTDKGNGAIFVSSELAEMLAICDKIYILQRGKLKGELSHDDLESEEVLQNAIQK